MGSRGMVRGEPKSERVPTLLIARESISGVDAFALQGVVEAFDPAVRPRVIGPCPGMPDPLCGAGLVEAPLVSGAVVGEHAADADAERIEVRERRAQEADAVSGSDRRPQLQIGLTACGIDRQVQLRPADPLAPALARAALLSAAATAAGEPAESFDVDLH